MKTPIAPPPALDVLVFRQAAAVFQEAHKASRLASNGASGSSRTSHWFLHQSESQNTPEQAAPLAWGERLVFGASLTLHSANVFYFTARFFLIP